MSRVNNILNKKPVSMFLAVSLIFSLLTVSRVSAVSYLGNGTKSNPYLIYTAEQLSGIRDNLAAHYKLANTVDLSGVDFKPIGILASPFTGSLTCDTDSDGTPKYAIKNLKIYNSAGEKNRHTVGSNIGYVDYKENKSGWEAALFGAAKGARFSNIAILDADITNTVVGQNRMNDDWSLNPGQDEQNTAVFIGDGKSITVENCSVTGKITSKSNHCGGMFGKLTDSDIKSSYSKVNITTTGFWCNGGFVGSGENNKISYCFSDSAMSFAKYVGGGFAGSQSGTVEHCYALGTLNRGNAFHQTELTGLTVKNSATKVTVNECGALTNNAKTENALTADATAQPDFTVTSVSVIDSLISQINSRISVISDTSKYVPGKVPDETVAGNENSNIEDGANKTSEEAVDNEPPMTADEISNLIKDLGKKAANNKLTYKDAMKGIYVKEEYARMTDEEKAKVDSLVIGSIETVFNASSKVVVAHITDEVDKFPPADRITSDNAEKILSVWNDYNSLPDTVKSYFQQKTVKALEKAAKAAEAAGNIKIVTTDMDSAVKKLQIGLIIAMASADVLAIAALTVLIIMITKTLKRIKTFNAGDPEYDIQGGNSDTSDD